MPAAELIKREGSQMEFQVEVSTEDLALAVEQVRKDYQRRTSVPGFRRGKVPLTMIDQVVGADQIQSEAEAVAAELAYQRAISEHQLEPLDEPSFEEAERGEDNRLRFRARVTVRPQVELGEYKDLAVGRPAARVTPDQVEEELRRLQVQRAGYQPIGDRPIQNGDLVIADYEMYLDGERHEQGDAQGYPLTVGSDRLFPELNEGLIGARVGEERAITISYAADHADAALAGKTAEYRVRVRDARAEARPPLDDDFARAVSACKTIGELRQRVADMLAHLARTMSDRAVRDRLIDMVTEQASLDVPASLVARQVRRRIEGLEEELAKEALTLERYLQRRSISEDDLRAELEPEARVSVKRAFVLDEIARREGIEVTEQEREEELRQLAESEGRRPEELRRELEREGRLKALINGIYVRKVVDLLVAHAKVSEEVESDGADEANTQPSE